MANNRHTLGQFEGTGALILAAQITGAGVVTSVSGPSALSADLSVTRVAAGSYSVSISNFKGPQGFAVPTISGGSATGTTRPIPCMTTAPSYSSDTLTFGYSMMLSSNGVLTDGDSYIQVFAF